MLVNPTRIPVDEDPLLTIQHSNRDDNVIRFNKRIMALATSDKIPLLERLNYSKIIINNLVEWFSSRSGKINPKIYNRVATKFADSIDEVSTNVYGIINTIVKEEGAKSLTRGANPVTKFTEFSQIDNSSHLYAMILIDNKPGIVDLGEKPNKYPAHGDPGFIGYIRPITDEAIPFCRSNTEELDDTTFDATVEVKQNALVTHAIVGIGNRDIEEVSDYLTQYSIVPIYMDAPVFAILHLGALKMKDPIDPKFCFIQRNSLGDLPTDYISISDSLRNTGSVLFETPTMSYDNVVNFIETHCVDPTVIGVGITIYRLAKDSKIVKALKAAVSLGKDVFIYIELSARGDEKQNLEVLRDFLALQKEGKKVRIIHACNGMKVHAKAFFAITKTGDIYSHVSTGNYNEKNAKTYADLQILSKDPVFGLAVVNLFQKISVRDPNEKWFQYQRHAFQVIIDAIEREGRRGVDGKIRIKCNHLKEPSIINALLQAAENGAKIYLSVRSTFPKALVGIDNIKMISHVGVFLEHARYYLFGDGISSEAYISSSDLLNRNLHKRIEGFFRVPDSCMKSIERYAENEFIDDVARV